MDPGFFYETVAPLMIVGSTSLIAISTLTSEVNFYTRLMRMRDKTTGMPLFTCLSIQLACQDCQDQGKAVDCIHLLHLVPRWQVRKIFLIPSRGGDSDCCMNLQVRDVLTKFQARRDIGLWFSNYGDRWIVTVGGCKHMLCVTFHESGGSITDVMVDAVQDGSFRVSGLESWLGVLVYNRLFT